MSRNIKTPTTKNSPRAPRQIWARKKKWLYLFFIFHFSFFIFQCGLDVEDPTPPSPPVWVQKSLPEEWPERGIDAHESGGIYLEWETNLEENIAAYLIYRAELFSEIDSIGKYIQIARCESDQFEVLYFIDSDILIRKRYYYKLRAEDVAENMSEYSDAIEYSLMPKISINKMSPNGTTEYLNNDRELSWTYNYLIEMEDYCLTVLTHDNDFVWRELFNPGNYVNGLETWIIPDTLKLVSNMVYKWRIDTGSIYVGGYETAGSESLWATFIYIRY